MVGATRPPVSLVATALSFGVSIAQCPVYWSAVQPGALAVLSAMSNHQAPNSLD